jgi:(p)ppGpp synthase/HD superfamily hydrolase
MSPEALIIKLCDRIDNISDLKEKSNKFGDKYYKETEKICRGLNRIEFGFVSFYELLRRIKETLEDYKKHRESQGVIL